MDDYPVKPSKYEWLWLFAAFFALALTQRWMSVLSGIEFVTATDSFSYLEIVRSAPAYPSVPLPFHHAQRFFFPWAFGSILSGVASEWVMRVSSTIVLLATAVIWLHVVCRATASHVLRVFACLLFYWNPYTYRYYLLAPAILPDQVFQLGLVSLLYGVQLWKNRTGGLWLVAGALICGLSRQTSLLMIPGLLLWAIQTRQPVLFLIPSLIFGTAYAVTGSIAAAFGTSSGNIDHIIGFFPWIVSESFSFGRLGEHVLRVILPLLPFFVLLRNPFAKTTWPLGLMGLGLISQPILAGPLHTTGNGSRLAALSLTVFLLMWIQQSVPAHFERRKKAGIAILFLLSFHHMYSRIGPPTVIVYTVMQLIGVAALGILFSTVSVFSNQQSGEKPKQ